MAVKRESNFSFMGVKKAALHLLLHKDTFDLLYGVQSSVSRGFFSSEIRFDGKQKGQTSAEAEGPPAPTCTLSPNPPADRGNSDSDE